MSYRDPTYVIFDGDEDVWAYRYMRGWKKSDRVDFDFRDAHDLDNMTSRAQSEKYVKDNLANRMEKSKAVVVLVGEKTKNLFRFVRWELELALGYDLPIIAVNLNEKRDLDRDRCPPIIRDACVVHIPFKLKAIRHALDKWPSDYRSLSKADRTLGARVYSADVYRSLGL